MGWSYRKSFGSGPFRVNLSNRGVSYSFGVKGARVNVSPKGTYVNLSSHGISYRQKIGGPPAAPAAHPARPGMPVAPQGKQIASAAVQQLSDTGSMDFISTLNDTSSRVSYVTWLGLLPCAVFLVWLLFSTWGSRTVIVKPANDSLFVRVSGQTNIRSRPYGRSAITGTAPAGASFLLLDSTAPYWFKVRAGDSAGYVGKRLAAIEQVHHDAQNTEQIYLANPYAGYEFLGGLIFFTLLIIRLHQTDKRRLTMELHYQMDLQQQQFYNEFNHQFAGFMRAAKVWQYLNAQQITDARRNAGAGKLIKRTPVALVSGHQLPFRRLLTNVKVPYIRLSSLELYFLPERLLIKRSGQFAAVFYKHLQISTAAVSFIEDENLPRDASVTGHTWRYVNKHGGPDRRFSNNKQLPVCRYSEYTLTSSTGLHEVISTSKAGAMDGFAAFITSIGALQAQQPSY